MNIQFFHDTDTLYIKFCKAEIAVLLNGEAGRFLPTKLEMSDIAYDVLLDTGINVSPLPVWLDEWAHSETYSNPRLLANIAREGIRL